MVIEKLPISIRAEKGGKGALVRSDYSGNARFISSDHSVLFDIFRSRTGVHTRLVCHTMVGIGAGQRDSYVRATRDVRRSS
jgi:hypothetical protein